MVEEVHGRLPCLELNFDRFSLDGRRKLESIGLGKVPEASDQVPREFLGGDVIGGDGIIVCLSCEGDLVLGTRQFFLERQHVLIGLKVWVGFRQAEEFRHGTGQSSFCCGQILDRARIRWIGGSLLASRHGRVSGFDDCFQRFPLVLHITFGDFDQVRNQLIASLQLHVDLSERVVVAIAKGNKLL